MRQAQERPEFPQQAKAVLGLGSFLCRQAVEELEDRTPIACIGVEQNTPLWQFFRHSAAFNITLLLLLVKVSRWSCFTHTAMFCQRGVKLFKGEWDVGPEDAEPAVLTGQRKYTRCTEMCKAFAQRYGAQDV